MKSMRSLATILCYINEKLSFKKIKLLKNTSLAIKRIE
jgi:hypothetical protein